MVNHRANSHSLRKLLGCGRRLMALCHTTAPRNTKPATCMASAVLAHWRQSVNTSAEAPGSRARKARPIHMDDHSTKLRSSRLSP